MPVPPCRWSCWRWCSRAAAGAPVGPLLPGEHPGSAAPEGARGRSESLVRLGDTALRSGEIETAVSLFDQATQLDAANVGAALGLGDALLAAGRDLDAGRAFERALAAQPGSPAAQYGYARAMIAIRRPEVAADFLRKLVAATRRRRLAERAWRQLRPDGPA